LLADLSAGRTIVTLAREEALFAGGPGTPARFEAGRVRGTKYFVPFAAEADALLVATRDGVCLVQKPFAVKALATLDPAQRFGEVPRHEGCGRGARLRRGEGVRRRRVAARVRRGDPDARRDRLHLGARPALLLQAREDARAALRLDGEPARAGARGDGVLRCVLIRRVQPTATLKGL